MLAAFITHEQAELERMQQLKAGDTGIGLSWLIVCFVTEVSCYIRRLVEKLADFPFYRAIICTDQPFRVLDVRREA